MTSHLLEFYGEECPGCLEMHELVDRLKKEEGIEIKQLEIWHNKENEKLLDEYDTGQCGGVPFFINTKTGKWVCGEESYEDLKKWAKGE
ncbi:MAG: thioredoxin family protein [Candidatus Paceibacterota bacterium]|jgi:hypothetical protein